MIKTFEFEVSNAARYYLNGDTSTAWFKTDLSRLTNTEGIDEIINTWIEENHPVIEDIKIVPVDVNFHNNGRGNTIHLFYTIIYR